MPNDDGPDGSPDSTVPAGPQALARRTSSTPGEYRFVAESQLKKRQLREAVNEVARIEFRKDAIKAAAQRLAREQPALADDPEQTLEVEVDLSAFHLDDEPPLTPPPPADPSATQFYLDHFPELPPPVLVTEPFPPSPSAPAFQVFHEEGRALRLLRWGIAPDASKQEVQLQVNKLLRSFTARKVFNSLMEQVVLDADALDLAYATLRKQDTEKEGSWRP